MILYAQCKHLCSRITAELSKNQINSFFFIILMTEISQVNFRIYFNSTQTKTHFTSNSCSLYCPNFSFPVGASPVCTHKLILGIQDFSYWDSNSFEFAALALFSLFAWLHHFPYFTKEKRNWKILKKTEEDVCSF